MEFIGPCTRYIVQGSIIQDSIGKSETGKFTNISFIDGIKLSLALKIIEKYNSKELKTIKNNINRRLQKESSNRMTTRQEISFVSSTLESTIH